MTNVSKRKLNPKQLKALRQQFTELVATADTKRSGDFFTELFTESEQVMFMKRLAVLLMIKQGYSRYRIARTLAMSPSTVQEFYQGYEQGDFDGLLQLTNRKSFDADKFWQTIEVLLRAGLPPRGKGRWKEILKHY